MKKFCPNIDCKSHHFIKDGSFRRTSDCRIIQRFRCQSCGKRFSNASFSMAKNQKKRTLNHIVFKFLASGISQRRLAKNLNVDKKTIQRKFLFLSKKAKLMNEKLRKKLHTKVTHLQFDDLITIEHTKMKPVTVSIAVDTNTRIILAAESSSIPAFGLLAEKSRKKYGSRKNEHKLGLQKLFTKIQPCMRENIIIDSDEHQFYPSFVKKYSPAAQHNRFKGIRGCIGAQGELKKTRFDPLFSINHTCAMLRDGIKRLARKTWCTTKKLEMLQKHLEIYIWYHNFYLLKYG